MSGYCGICNKYYDCHHTEHDAECPGEEVREDQHLTDMERFQRDADEQGVPIDEQERIWNEEYR